MGRNISSRLKARAVRISVGASTLLASACLAPGQDEQARERPSSMAIRPSATMGGAPSVSVAVGPGPVPVVEASAAYFAGTPACGRFEPNGLLDIEAGCAGNLCLSMTYEEAVQAAGLPSHCDATDKLANCTWHGDIQLTFPDLDGDGIADPGLEADTLHLSSPAFRGTTKAGLGIGVSMRCFNETYGEPSSLDVQPTYTFTSYFQSGAFDFYATDWNQAGGVAPDGLTDALFIYSSPRAPRIRCRKSADCPVNRPKCAITETPLGTLPVCMPLLGSKQPGEACSRPTEQRGVDDCGIDLYCNTLAGPANARCAKICDGSLESCGKEEACVRPGSASLGSCMPRCDIFATNDGCPDGSSCKNVFLLHGEAQLCVKYGPQTVGQSCAMAECAGHLTCSADGSGVSLCWERCDDTHPCASGYCSAPDFEGGLGYCVR